MPRPMIDNDWFPDEYDEVTTRPISDTTRMQPDWATEQPDWTELMGVGRE